MNNLYALINIPELFFEIAMLAAGCGLVWYVNKQRFNRRSPGGLQGFSSYERSVATTLFEKVIKLIGIALIILGILCLLV